MVLRIKFVDFWDGFDEYYNTFVNVLSEKYEIEICDHLDYLIYSIFGYENLRYDNCVKIFCTGENLTPDFNLCDYAIGFDIMEFGDRYMRLSLYALYGIEELRNPKIVDSQKALNRKSCSFVVSNGTDASERTRFFICFQSINELILEGAMRIMLEEELLIKKNLFLIINLIFLLKTVLKMGILQRKSWSQCW